MAVASYGQPIAYLPLSWRWLTIGIVIMVLAGIVMLATNSFERRETAHGILRAWQGETQILPSDRGVVRTVRVDEGQVVRAGQILATVSTDHVAEDGAASPEEMLRALDAQKRSLDDRLQAVDFSDQLQKAAAASQMAAIQAKLSAAQADLSAASDQHRMAVEDYQKVLPIAQRGFISHNELRRHEEAVVTTQRDVADASGQISQLKAELAEQRSVAAQRPALTTKDRGEIGDLITSVEERRLQYEQTRGFAIRAPVSGRITTVQANVGGVADPARPLMSIVPLDARMTAVLYVPSRAAGFLAVGQRVRIRYDAFPFQRFGAASGTIVSVSHTVLRPQDIDGAVKMDEPSYRVVASLARQDVGAFGERHVLYPGMALTADVILERRSLLAWLIEPLLAMRDRA